MRLVHLSDLHFGAITMGRPEALREAVQAVGADLTVISGDLTQKGRHREFVAAREFLETLPGPRFVVPGNHDMPHGVHLWARFEHPWRTFREVMGEELEPTLHVPGMVVAGMNSGRPGGLYVDWSRGRLSAGQLIRLRQQYLEAAPEALRVLVVHHPPAAPPQGTRRHLIDKRPALFGALNEAGVDLVLSGHFHLSYAVPVKLPGVHPRHFVLSVTSTATSHRLKGEPNGFHVIEGDRQQLRVQAWTWNDAAYVPTRAWQFFRGEDGDWTEAKPPSRDHKLIQIQRDRDKRRVVTDGDQSVV